MHAPRRPISTCRNCIIHATHHIVSDFLPATQLSQFPFPHFFSPFSAFSKSLILALNCPGVSKGCLSFFFFSPVPSPNQPLDLPSLLSAIHSPKFFSLASASARRYRSSIWVLPNSAPVLASYVVASPRLSSSSPMSVRRNGIQRRRYTVATTRS